MSIKPAKPASEPNAPTTRPTPSADVARRILSFALYGLVVRTFALEAGRLGSILSRVKPNTLKLVSAVTLAKRSAIKCSAEDEMNRE